jgi:hypothetical protein
LCDVLINVTKINFGVNKREEGEGVEGEEGDGF